MIQVAIMGLGTVGTGVAKVIAQNTASIAKKLGQPLQVKTILVRHFKDGPYRHLMTDDFSEIEQDPDIRVVVETIGGTGPAYEYTKRALAAGKHVVTANKQLVAEHGCELLELAAAHHVSYLFEASVGGGIPVLHPLTQCLAANQIDEIYGILNGTTNYILTRMVQSGASFAEALSEAQKKGYAEADPTADVEGIDAGRKTCILADLAFGKQVDPAQVPMEGISRIALKDVRIAEEHGYRMKLLGRTVRLPDGRHSAYVAPHLLPEDGPMAHVQDVFNAVMVHGNATGDVMFYGKGAGELPTASACVSDILEVLLEKPDRRELTWSRDTAGFADPGELVSRYYLRIQGTPEAAAAAFGDIEIFQAADETVFLTEKISGNSMRKATQSLHVMACYRVLS